MANLIAARRNGKRVEPPRSRTIKSVHIEVYPQIDIGYQGCQFDTGTAIVLVPTMQLRTRKGNESDSTLRFFSGLISKDPNNHPNWERELLSSYGAHGQIGYELPGSNQNFTRSDHSAIYSQRMSSCQVLGRSRLWRRALLSPWKCATKLFAWCS